jgi:hypothetical protein
VGIVRAAARQEALRIQEGGAQQQEALQEAEQQAAAQQELQEQQHQQQEPRVLVAVETVEDDDSTAAQAAVEDVNARTINPDVEEEDDRFDVQNDFKLYNPARKWTSYELEKATLMDDKVSVGTGARKITWNVRDDIDASNVEAAEFRDVGICNYDFFHSSKQQDEDEWWMEEPKEV